MDLAKDCLDVALFTDRLDVPEYWRDEVGLVPEHVLPIRRGHDQHRFDLAGSVFKVNVVAAGLPRDGASTITAVVVADATRAGTTVADPDGTAIRFVEPGDDVGQIAVVYAVSDLQRAATYYGTTLGWERIGDDGARCGRTTVRFEEQAGVAPMPALPVRGWAYTTVQIRDCDAEHAAVLERAAWKVRHPARSATWPASRWFATPTATGSSSRSEPR